MVKAEVVERWERGKPNTYYKGFHLLVSGEVVATGQVYGTVPYLTYFDLSRSFEKTTLQAIATAISEYEDLLTAETPSGK